MDRTGDHYWRDLGQEWPWPHLSAQWRGSCLELAVDGITIASPVGNRPRNVIILAFAGLLLFGTLDILFDLRDTGIQALGRDPTLTDRTFVWADVLKVDNNFLIGTGFESFWLGPRAEALWLKYWWRPNQAHNGYIETFINLGAVGVGLLVVAIAAAFQKIMVTVPKDRYLGPIRFALLVCILILNYTDATFKALHLLYFVFFLIAIEYPKRTTNTRLAPLSSAPPVPQPLPRPRWQPRASYSVHPTETSSAPRRIDRHPTEKVGAAPRIERPPSE